MSSRSIPQPSLPDQALYLKPSRCPAPGEGSGIYHHPDIGTTVVDSYGNKATIANPTGSVTLPSSGGNDWQALASLLALTPSPTEIFMSAHGCATTDVFLMSHTKIRGSKGSSITSTITVRPAHFYDTPLNASSTKEDNKNGVTGTIQENVGVGNRYIRITPVAGVFDTGMFVQVHHGAASQIFEIKNVDVTASPRTCYLEESVEFPFVVGDTCTGLTSLAQDIEVSDLTVSGTGNELAEFAGVANLYVHDCKFTPTTAASSGVGFDIATRDARIERCRFDMASAVSGSPFAWYAQSNVRTRNIDCSSYNGAGYAYALYDCFSCGIEGAYVNNHNAGIYIDRFDANSLGNYDCWVTGARIIRLIGSTPIGVFVDHSWRTKLRDVTVLQGLTGATAVKIGAASVDTSLEKARIENIPTGISIVYGATGTKVRDVSLDACTTVPMLIQGGGIYEDIRITNTDSLRCINITGAAGGGTLADPVTLKQLDITSSYVGGNAVQTLGHDVTIDGARLKANGNSSYGLWCATPASGFSITRISNVTVTTTGTTVGGIYLDTNACLWVGDNVDLSACATAITGPGHASLGTVTLNGVTPVAYSFPPIVATSKVRLTRKTAGTTPGAVEPTWAITPGTGVSVVSATADANDVYQIEIS